MDNITPLFAAHSRPASQVSFTRPELAAILSIYGRCVAAGLYRDYAIFMGREAAVFSAFERAAERPEVQILKQPDLGRKQGAFSLVSRSGTVLKRGHELRPLLALLERKLVRAVAE